MECFTQCGACGEHLLSISNCYYYGATWQFSSTFLNAFVLGPKPPEANESSSVHRLGVGADMEGCSVYKASE